MTTIQIQPITALDLPSAEDPMELSPDMDRPFVQGEDIDIDLDLMADQPLEGDDENMGDEFEVHPDQSLSDVQPAIDAAMGDDEITNHVFAEALDVYDEDLQAPESELEVVEGMMGEDLQDSRLHGQLHGPSDHQKEHFTAHDKHDGTPENQRILFAVPKLSVNSLPDNQNEEHHSPHNTNDGSIQGTSLLGEDATPLLEIEPVEQEASEARASVEEPSNAFENDHSQQEERDDSEPDVKEPTANFADLNGSSISAAIYVHPVVVTYQDSEMSLFPPYDETPGDTQTFLLQDEQLARENMRSLLGACRSVLGDSIPEQDDLEISIRELGLEISECATEASYTTLIQLIDIYLHLHHCDGVLEPPPLCIDLYTRTKFSHRLDFLSNCIREGKGLTHVRSTEEAEESEVQGLGVEELEATTLTAPDDPDIIKQPQILETLVDNKETNDASSVSLGADAANKTEVSNFSEIDSRHYQTEEERVGTNGDSPAEDHEQKSKTLELPNQTHIHGSIASPARIGLSERDDSDIGEDGDIIDFEDDGSREDSSIGSSTVQGDVLNTSAGQGLTPSTNVKAPKLGTQISQKSDEASETLIVTSPQVSLDICAPVNTGEDVTSFPEKEPTSIREGVIGQPYSFSHNVDKVAKAVVREIASDKKDEPLASSPSPAQIQCDADDVEDIGFIQFDEEIFQGYDTSRDFEDHGSEENLNQDPSELAEGQIPSRKEALPDDVKEVNKREPAGYNGGINIDVAAGEDVRDSVKIENNQDDQDLESPTFPAPEASLSKAEPEYDEDEITYDEEEELPKPAKASSVEADPGSSPNSLKRPRSHTGSDDGVTAESKDTKRVRSS